MMKINFAKLLFVLSFFNLTLGFGKAEAQSPSVIPAGLSCTANLTLPSGKTEAVPVFLGDHLMFGPIAAATLQAGGESTKTPLESSGFVGMIFEDLKSGLVVLSIEAKISRVIFEPSYSEDGSISRGVLVLSRNQEMLSKGVVSLTNFGGGAVHVECELK